MIILHTADLHLDSKMETHLSLIDAKKRKDEILNAFKDLVSYAINKNARAILISGDLFDQKNPSIKTINFCKDLIKNNQNLLFIYTPGNHDEFTSFDEKIDNFIVLNDNDRYYLDDILVIAKDNSNINLDKDSFNIVLMHKMLGTKVDKDVIDQDELKNKNIDYLALGHIHKSSISKLDERGILAYPGCLAPRGFDETGEKGFIELEINNRRLSAKFIPLKGRCFVSVKVDISLLHTHLEIQEKIYHAIKDIDSINFVEVILTGSFFVDTEKHIDSFIEHFKDSFFFFRIKDETTLFINPKDYENDITLKGEFVRTVLNNKDLDQSLKDEILVCGLKALLGGDI